MATGMAICPFTSGPYRVRMATQWPLDYNFTRIQKKPDTQKVFEMMDRMRDTCEITSGRCVE
eukprot:1314749-Pyramimonas_sp.AAC.1